MCKHETLVYLGRNYYECQDCHQLLHRVLDDDGIWHMEVVKED